MDEVKAIWKTLKRSEKAVWKRLEELDEKRYLCERKMYFQSLGGDNNSVGSRNGLNKRSPRGKKRSSSSTYNRKTKLQKLIEIDNSKKTETKVYAQYLYIDENNDPMMQIEVRSDRKCPLCSYECVSS